MSNLSLELDGVVPNWRCVSDVVDLVHIFALGPGDRATLDALPLGEGREQLVDDLALLTDMFCQLMDCPAVGLRGTRVPISRQASETLFC